MRHKPVHHAGNRQIGHPKAEHSKACQTSVSPLTGYDTRVRDVGAVNISPVQVPRIPDSRHWQLLAYVLPEPVRICTKSIDLLKLAERPDGTIDLLADALLEPSGAIAVRDRTDAAFTVAGKPSLLRPRPWMLGAQTGPALLASNSGYQWRAKRYEPDASALRQLRGERRDVRVLTFFGSWCPHCKRHLPFLLKVEERLAGAKIRFDYFGLPSAIRSDPEAVKWGVEGVPTAIVFVGGAEVGRIPSSQWSNPEVAIDLVLHPPEG